MKLLKTKLLGTRCDPALELRIKAVADKLEEGNSSRVIRKCIDAHLAELEAQAGINFSEKVKTAAHKIAEQEAGSIRARR